MILELKACGPGSLYGNRRRFRRKLTPFVLKESFPDTSEFSVHASGPFLGALTVGQGKFLKLAPSYNKDIVFQDSEGNGEDHMMSLRCRDRLDILAVSVMNQFPGTRLRVLEAFDTEHIHKEKSLHYEGRAVDLSTSDRDRTKLGMLARLAVEAGFDYVYYKSKTHIHASVKVDIEDITRNGGCFPANASVDTPSGKKLMADLKIGEFVLSSTPDGTLVYSQVLLFLHREQNMNRVYNIITTEKNSKIVLTSSHLIFVTIDKSLTNISNSYVTFAKNVEVGHYLFVKNNSSGIELQKVVNITTVIENEHYAPLTEEGSIVVNDVLASCYAMIESHKIAHAVFTPIRLLLNSKKAAMHFLQLFTSEEDMSNKVEKPLGVHWYAALLYKMSYYLLSDNYMYH
ncbi:hypothetical protein JTE90_009827 [Oedothorax gibbosus]|uniref:Hedgehog protein n=1 Tax=Oedothorax gibbosus TaxID=931172 RepID=A0AAV6UBR5_9ARAC|nr:hypothetical protein JTE90_009827 [Oedothorax gibbosus]